MLALLEENGQFLPGAAVQARPHGYSSGRMA
jgi:hypothetical protein